MVWWHIWQRVTGRWVTVTGKRRELDLPVTSCSASRAAVATPCPVLAAPFTACGIPDWAVWGREVRWHRRWCPGDGVRLAGCRCPGPPGNRAAGLPFSGRGTSLGERSDRLKAAPGTFHHAPVKAKPHEVADCPAAGGQGPGRQSGEPRSRRLRGHGGPAHMPGG